MPRKVDMENRAENPSITGSAGPIFHQGPASWAETLAGILLFIVMGAFLVLYELPIFWDGQGSSCIRGAAYATLLIFPALGVAAGWMAGSPRWSYPYAGLAVLTSWYFYGDGILYGWRAMAPLLLALGAGLLVTRSFHPLYLFFDNAMHDLTLVSFGLTGWLPMLVWFSFDEIDMGYTLPWVVAATLLMVGATVAYLRSRSTQQRVISLSAGVLLSLALMILGQALYQEGWVDIGWALAMSALIATFMLAPAFFSLPRQAARV